MILANFEDK